MSRLREPRNELHAPSPSSSRFQGRDQRVKWFGTSRGSMTSVNLQQPRGIQGLFNCACTYTLNAHWIMYSTVFFGPFPSRKST